MDENAARCCLSLLLHHGLTRSEVSSLSVADILDRRATSRHLRVQGRNGELRRIPLHQDTYWAVSDYLRSAGHPLDKSGPLFRPIRNNRTRVLDRPLSPDGIYRIVRRYLRALDVSGGAQTLRATAQVGALAHQPDLALIQTRSGLPTIASKDRYRLIGEPIATKL